MDNKYADIYQFLSELRETSNTSYLAIKLFIKFLKKENVLNPYIKNLNSQHSYRDSSYRNDIFSTRAILNGVLVENRLLYNTLKGEEMFSYAFCWGTTEEGNRFWAKLSLKWRETFREFVNKLNAWKIK